jgi:hypothetical protein
LLEELQRGSEAKLALHLAAAGEQRRDAGCFCDAKRLAEQV